MCQQFTSSLPCKIGEQRCTFPHNKNEMNLWYMELDGEFSYPHFMDELRKNGIGELTGLEHFYLKNLVYVISQSGQTAFCPSFSQSQALVSLSPFWKLLLSVLYLCCSISVLFCVSLCLYVSYCVSVSPSELGRLGMSKVHPCMESQGCHLVSVSNLHFCFSVSHLAFSVLSFFCLMFKEKIV